MSEHEAAPRRRGSESTYGGDTYGEAIDQAVRSSSATRGNSVFPSWTPASPQGTWELAESGAASNANGARGHSALPMMLGAMSPLAALTMKAFGVGHQTTDVSATSSAPNEHAGAGGKESFDRNETVPRHAEDHDEDALHTLSQRNRQRLDDFGYSMAVWETLSEVTRKQVAEMVGWLAFVGLLSVVVMKGKGLAALRALLKTDMAKALGYAIPAGAASVHFSNWFNAAWDANGNPAKRGKARDEFAGLCMSLAAWRMQFGFGKGANAEAPGKVTAEVVKEQKTRAQLTTTAAANTTTLQTQLNPTTNQYEVSKALPGPTEGPNVPSGQWLSPLGPQVPAAGLDGMEGLPAFGGGGFSPEEYSDPNELVAHLESAGYVGLSALEHDGPELAKLIKKAWGLDRIYLVRLQELWANGAAAAPTAPNVHTTPRHGEHQRRAPESRLPYLQRLKELWAKDKSAVLTGQERPKKPASLAIASNRLPGKASKGGLVTGVEAAVKGIEGGAMWFGSAGQVDDPGDAQLHVREGNGIDYVGLDLPKEEQERHYIHDSNEIVWPFSHQMPTRSPETHTNISPAYSAVNRRIAELMMWSAKQGAVDPYEPAWIHDYHHYPLGGHLLDLGYMGPRGFFKHIPFPSPEMWSLMPGHDDLMRWALQYDLFGVHTDLFKNNFLQSAEEFGATRVGDSLEYRGRRIQVGAFPIGIDPHLFADSASGTPPAEFSNLPGLHNGVKVIFCVDRIDYTKAVRERLLAHELLLKKNGGAWKRRVTLVQVAVRSREGIPEYDREHAAVKQVADRINAELGDSGWTPILFMENGPYPQEQLAAMAGQSDVGAVTPEMDGMNLTAKEYAASQRNRTAARDPRNPPGRLVLSVGAGAAAQLGGTELEDLRLGGGGKMAIMTDPSNISHMAGALDRALNMGPEESFRRMEPMIDNVFAYDAKWWGSEYLSALKDTRKKTRK